MRSEISSLVTISCFRSAIISDRSDVIAVGGSSVSMLTGEILVALGEGSVRLVTWGRIDAMSRLICSRIAFLISATAEVIISRREVISFFKACISAVYWVAVAANVGEDAIVLWLVAVDMTVGAIEAIKPSES